MSLGRFDSNFKEKNMISPHNLKLNYHFLNFHRKLADDLHRKSEKEDFSHTHINTEVEESNALPKIAFPDVSKTRFI